MKKTRLRTVGEMWPVKALFVVGEIMQDEWDYQHTRYYVGVIKMGHGQNNDRGEEKGRRNETSQFQLLHVLEGDGWNSLI